MPKISVYCAGPLFSPGEREEMAAIARVLGEAGFGVFLPQRDGIELAAFAAQLPSQMAGEATSTLARAIFALDVYVVTRWADAVVVNMNGRVPDEGAMVEAALGWLSGKAIVLYKKDPRALLGGRDNPLLLGLGGFATVDDILVLPEAIRATLQTARQRGIEGVLATGKHIMDIRRGSSGKGQDDYLAIQRALGELL